MRAFVICLVAAAAMVNGSAFADSISSASYSTSCTADGSSLMVGTQSCSAGVAAKGSTYADANANVANTIAVSASQYSDLRATQSIHLNTSVGSTSSAEAASSVDYRETLTTSGPLRSGFVLVQLVDNNVTAEDNAVGNGSFSMSLLNSNPFGASAGCSMDVAQMQCGSTSDALRHFDNLGGFSVELGQAFTLGYDGSLSGFASQLTGNGSSSLDLDYQFRFVESDGVTPVQVFAPAPEPGTWQMLGVTCVGFALLRERLTKLTRSSRRNSTPLV